MEERDSWTLENSVFEKWDSGLRVALLMSPKDKKRLGTVCFGRQLSSSRLQDVGN